MTKQIFKTILAGILGGIALFMLPFFIIRVLLFFMLMGAAFKLLGAGRYGRQKRWEHFKNMTPEEKEAWMSRMHGHCGYQEVKVTNETK